MPSKRDVTRQMKYVELAIIGDHQFIKEFNLTEDEAVEYMLEAANIANAVGSSFSSLNRQQRIPSPIHPLCLDAGSRLKCSIVSRIQ